MEMTGTLQTVEMAWIDLRLAHLRQRDHRAEELLLESIRAMGIKEPLVVVAPRPQRCLLLDGFKRYRCARRLSIGVVPVVTLDGDEKEGLLALMRYSRDKGLTELEHGAIVDRLHTRHGMSIRQIAEHLGCSTGWVGMRLGIIAEMSALVRRKVLSGRFPPRVYLYSLRPFTRVNSNPEDVDRFVMAVSGRGLSTRELFLLTHAYFEGSRVLRTCIEQGGAQEVLEAMSSQPAVDGDSAVQTAVDEIRTVVAGMDRLIASLPRLEIGGDIAPLKAHLAAAGLLRRIKPFTRSIREFYGRTTEKVGGAGVVGPGQAQEAHRPLAGTGREDRADDHCHPWSTARTDIAIPSPAAA